MRTFERMFAMHRRALYPEHCHVDHVDAVFRRSEVRKSLLL